MRLANGEALTRVASAGAGAVGVGGEAGAGAAAFGAGAAAVGAGFDAAPCSVLPAPSTFSPGFPIHATMLPTGTVMPSGTITFNSCPSARATSSMTALSVSTSASVSPDFTASPSCFVHFTRRPSSIVGDSASMWTLVAIQVQNLPCRRHDLFGRSLRGSLEHLVVWHRNIGLGHALHGRIEIVERIPLDEIDHLRTDAGVGPAFFDHHRAVGLLHGIEDRRFIERPERPQIEHLGGHVLLGELVGGL